jgi:sucrose porin
MGEPIKMKLKTITAALVPVLFVGSIAHADDDIEARLKLLEQRLEKAEFQDFTFHAYARSGFVTNKNFNGAQGVGAYMTPAGAYDGPVGRLGLEDDTYVETKMDKHFRSDNGTEGRYHIMFADAKESKNDWTGNNSANNHEVNMNVREAFAEVKNPSGMKNTVFEEATFWAGKRFDRNNFDIHFFDSDIIFLAGTGAGVYDVKLGSGKGHFSVIARDFRAPDGVNTDSGVNLDVEDYILTANTQFGPIQFMINGIAAPDNDASTADANKATSGLHAMFAYHGDSFLGTDGGWFKFGALVGKALGARLKNVGSDGNLQDDAFAVRLFGYGVKNLGGGFSIAPAILAEQSKDRYVDGDEFSWVSANLRMVNQVNDNVSFLSEVGYQWMDLEMVSGDVQSCALF